MRTTWEKIVHHVGTIYGHDISNELQNRKTVTITKPEYTQAVQDKHADRVARHTAQQQRLDAARQAKKAVLEQAVADGTDTDAPMELAVLTNEIEEAAYQATVELPVKLTDEEATEHSNAWRSYRERVS